MLLVSFDTPWKHQKTRCFQGVSKETSGMIWVKCHRETTWLSPEDNLSFNQISTERRALTLSWRKPLSYRNQSSDLLCKSMDWFLYDNGLRHERVKQPLIAYYPLFLPKWKLYQNSIKLLKNRNWTFPVVLYFTWIVEFVSNISSMITVISELF